MRYLLALALLMACGCSVGSDGHVADLPTEHVRPLGERITIIAGSMRPYYDVAVIRDKESGQEWIVVNSGDGVAIAPIPR